MTDILGKSSRAILTAIADGTDDPQVLAAMARGKLQNKHDSLVAALHGRVNEHQRQMLQLQLRLVAFLDEQISVLDAEVAKRLAPFRAEIERLDTIPGVRERIAEVILAECGADMSRFPSADHLASWAALAPWNRQSGGKRHNARTRKGNKTLRAALAEAGQAAGRTKGTYLGSIYRRVSGRRGGKRAALAVGRHILHIAYHILRDGVTYRELGANYYDERRKLVIVRSSVKRLERLGYKVTVEVA